MITNKLFLSTTFIIITGIMIGCNKKESISIDKNTSFAGAPDFIKLYNGKMDGLFTVKPSSHIEILNEIYPKFVYVAPPGNNGFLNGNFDIEFPIGHLVGDSSDLTFQLLFENITPNNKDISMVISTYSNSTDSGQIAITPSGAPFYLAARSQIDRNGADSLFRWQNKKMIDAKFNDFSVKAKRRNQTLTIEIYGIQPSISKLYSKSFNVNNKGNFYLEWFCTNPTNSNDISNILIPINFLWKDEKSYIKIL